jgi:hypothetical protein
MLFLQVFFLFYRTGNGTVRRFRFIFLYQYFKKMYPDYLFPTFYVQFSKNVVEVLVVQGSPDSDSSFAPEKENQDLFGFYLWIIWAIKIGAGVVTKTIVTSRRIININMGQKRKSPSIMI